MNHVAADGQVVFEYIGETSGVDRANRDAENKINRSNANISANMDKHNSNIKGKLASFAKTAAVIGATALAATAAITLKIGKKVLEEYANYEQLVGGVDTLFKESSQKVQEYANNAFKTAGLSANEYMETVTSFSASLLQSLGGDTAKAADYADMAITDMSDNANKMGTDMGAIQYAYQGFAKQNYTMLDNLKLGYGGTKEEMARLLADAEKLSGKKYNLNNLKDVYSAIHVVQTQLGITGTTAKEASSTITGSISSMKSAFKNLLAGLGDADADIEKLIENVIGSFENVVKNVSPIIENVLVELGKNMPRIIYSVMGVIKTIVTTLTTPENIKMISESAVSILLSLATGIMDSVGVLVPALLDVITNIVVELSDPKNLKMLVESATAMLEKISDSLIDNLPILLPAVISIITGLMTELSKEDNLTQLVIAAIAILGALATALTDSLGTLLPACGDVVSGIVSELTNETNSKKMRDAGGLMLINFVLGLVGMIDNLPPWAKFILGFTPLGGVTKLSTFAGWLGIDTPTGLTPSGGLSGGPARGGRTTGPTGNNQNYASGVTNFRGGLARINDVPGDRFSGEIVRLPRGTDVIPHDVSVEAIENLLSGGARASAVQTIIVQPNSIYLDGKKIATSTNGHNYSRLAVTRGT